MENLKDLFVAYCEKKKYQYECGYDYCDCNNFSQFVNVVVKGKTHTLYCMDNGTFVFDKTEVKTVQEICTVLKNKKED